MKPVKTFSGGKPNYVIPPETFRNERIKSLALQSMANVRFWNADNDSYEVGHDELEKFAELVAEQEREECIAIVLDNSDGEGICCTDNVIKTIRARGEK